MKTVGIYVYDQAEVLDFAGPFEVFSTASRLVQTADEGFDVCLIGEEKTTPDKLVVHARGGFRVQPTCSIQNHAPLDVLIVPGGVHEAEMLKPSVTRWILASSDVPRRNDVGCPSRS